MSAFKCNQPSAVRTSRPVSSVRSSRPAPTLSISGSMPAVRVSGPVVRSSPSGLDPPMTASACEPSRVSRCLLNVDSDDHLSWAQLAEYEYEFFKFQMLCKSTEINYCDLDRVINALTFRNLCQDVQDQCPLLTQILETFVHRDEHRKIKTAVEKLR